MGVGTSDIRRPTLNKKPLPGGYPGRGVEELEDELELVKEVRREQEHVVLAVGERGLVVGVVVPAEFKAAHDVFPELIGDGFRDLDGLRSLQPTGRSEVTAL